MPRRVPRGKDGDVAEEEEEPLVLQPLPETPQPERKGPKLTVEIPQPDRKELTDTAMEPDVIPETPLEKIPGETLGELTRHCRGKWYPGSLLYPLYPKDRGMLWFYVEAARCP